MTESTERTEITGQDKNGDTETRRHGRTSGFILLSPLDSHAKIAQRFRSARRKSRSRAEVAEDAEKNPRRPDRASRGEGHTGIENTSAT
jgi:hypothetical protein